MNRPGDQRDSSDPRWKMTPPSILPPTLSYSTDAVGTRPIGPAVWLCSWIGFDAAIIFVLMILSPKGEQILKDFKMQVPLITRIWLTLTHWFVNDFGWALFVLVIAGVMATILAIRPTLTTADGRRWPRTMARMILTLLFAIPVTIAIFAAVMPYITLINSLSSPNLK